MSFVTISPNMGLTIPITGVELGPDWANELNNSLLILDAHDHSPGKGALITPLAMSIDSDLSINQNNLTSVRSVRLESQPGTLGSPGDVGCIYQADVDLYYNDGSGNPIRITQNGSITGTTGSISNLIPPASASYVPLNGKFVWQSAVNTPAHLDAASIILRNFTVNSFGITLSPPLGLTANYQVTLPPLPSQTNVMTLNTSGTMGSITYDQVGQNMTATGANAIIADVTSVPVGVANLVGTSMNSTGADAIAGKITATGANAIAGTMNSTGADAIGGDMTSSGANVVASRRTRSVGTTVGIGGVAISNAVGSYNNGSTSYTAVTNLSVTITTSGRPVRITLISSGSGSTSYIGVDSGSDEANVAFEIRRGGSGIAQFEVRNLCDNSASGHVNNLPPGAIDHIDPVGAGTYTYALFGKSNNLGSAIIGNAKLVAYEL